MPVIEGRTGATSGSSSNAADAEVVVSHLGIVRGGAGLCDRVGSKVTGSYKSLASAVLNQCISEALTETG
jgi:hypothetical protein